MMTVTPDTTPDDLAECIGHLNHLAKREIPVVGTPEFPTPWDRAHRLMDEPLDHWLAARQLATPA